MKTSIFYILAFSVLFSKTGNAGQKVYNHNVGTIINEKSSQQDTIQYLKDNIVAHKSKFINQPLSVLLNSLSLNVKSYIFRFNNRRGAPIDVITLFFEDNKTVPNKLHNNTAVPSLTIHLATPVPLSKVAELLNKSHGNWLPAENELYGKQIVGDVTSSERSTKNVTPAPPIIDKDGKIKLM